MNEYENLQRCLQSKCRVSLLINSFIFRLLILNKIFNIDII